MFRIYQKQFVFFFIFVNNIGAIIAYINSKYFCTVDCCQQTQCLLPSHLGGEPGDQKATQLLIQARWLHLPEHPQVSCPNSLYSCTADLASPVLPSLSGTHSPSPRRQKPARPCPSTSGQWATGPIRSTSISRRSRPGSRGPRGRLAKRTGNHYNNNSLHWTELNYALHRIGLNWNLWQCAALYNT